MTLGEKIALITLIVTVVFGLIAGVWALFTWLRRDKPPADPPRPPTKSEGLDGDLPAASGARATWLIEPIRGARYNLRNISADTAQHVYADISRAPAINRGLPVDRRVLAHDAIQIMLGDSWNSPIPPSLYLRWEGQPEWVAVPIPQ